MFWQNLTDYRGGGRPLVSSSPAEFSISPISANIILLMTLIYFICAHGFFVHRWETSLTQTLLNRRTQKQSIVIYRLTFMHHIFLKLKPYLILPPPPLFLNLLFDFRWQIVYLLFSYN